MRNEAEAAVKTRYTQETGIDITYGEKSWRSVQSVIDIIQNHMDAHAGDRRANTHLPSVRLRVSNGTATKFVNYSAVHELSEDWQIVGFRVSEKGAGFDRKLLSMMGASTKTDEKTRGGLGEGLKMSVVHLVRNGADVKTFSQNEDETWSATPSIVDNTLQYTGKVWPGNNSGNSGSVTDVNFSGSAVPKELKEQLLQVLDARKGEGLGKYILDFRGAEFAQIIHRTKELSANGIPPGRVYVKGLLVEERGDLVGSYNLADKFAIAGRDRKSVKDDVLRKAVKTHLEHLKDPEEISSFLTRLTSALRSTVEESVFANYFKPSPQQVPVFRTVIKEAFNFSPGSKIVANSPRPDDIRFANERGYEVIDLSDRRYVLVNFIEDLYPENVVSMRQLQSTTLMDTKVEPETNSIDQLNAIKNIFSELLTSEGIDASALSNLGFEIAGSAEMRNLPHGTLFLYDNQKHVILINSTQEPTNFILLVDLFAELSKAVTRSGEFNPKTQDVLTRLAGAVIASINPDLLNPLHLSEVQNGNRVNNFESYPVEQRIEDRLYMEFEELARRADGFDLEKDDLFAINERMKAISSFLRADKDNNRFSDYLAMRGQYKTVWALEDGVYELIYGQGLRKIRTVRKPSSSSRHILLPKDQAQYNLVFSANTYIPYTIKDGETINVTVSDGENIGGELVIQRRGNRLIKTFRDRSGNKLDSGRAYWLFPLVDNFSVHANLLKFHPNKPISISIEKTGRQSTAEMPETNQGREFIPSHMTIDYGREVWMEPMRILLDAMQNHIDANGGKVPNVKFTVVDNSGNVQYIDEETLKTLPEHRIIGISISDEGQGYPTSYLTTLGKTSKGDMDLGKFGEGLKLLSAACVQQGIDVQLRSRNWIASPGSFPEVVKDYATGTDQVFRMLGYDMDWLDQPIRGSQTSFSLIPLESGMTRLSRTELMEVQYNFRYSRYWQDWIQVLDPRIKDQHGREGLGKYILERDELVATNGNVSLLPNRSGEIFEKGLFVTHYSRAHRDIIFGYNLDETIINTRERNSIDEDVFTQRLRDYYAQLNDVNVMKHILATIRDNPEVDYYESTLIASLFEDSYGRDKYAPQNAAWRQAYYEVFGDQSILSLRSVSVSRKHSDVVLGELGDKSGSRRPTVQSQVEKAIQNESHIGRERLVVLPADITTLLTRTVKTSFDEQIAYDSQEVALSEDDKEKLMHHLRSANEAIGKALEQCVSVPVRKAYLNRIIRVKFFEQRLRSLQAISEENIRVRIPEYPALGSVEGRTIPHVDLNQTILQNPGNLLDTYTHEAAHFLSGSYDYELNFQRFLALIAAGGIIPPTKQRKRLN